MLIVVIKGKGLFFRPSVKNTKRNTIQKIKTPTTNTYLPNQHLLFYRFGKVLWFFWNDYYWKTVNWHKLRSECWACTNVLKWDCSNAPERSGESFYVSVVHMDRYLLIIKKMRGCLAVVLVNASSLVVGLGRVICKVVYCIYYS